MNQLDREVDVFCRHLTGESPDDYVIQCYRRAHELEAQSRTRFDSLAVRIASSSCLLTGIIDSGAMLLGGRLLRHKLVLTLAILENSSAYSSLVNGTHHASRSVFFVKAAQLAILYSFRVVLSVLCLLPLRIFCMLIGDEKERAS